MRALANVPRNMDDEMLKALAKTDGVIQMVGFAELHQDVEARLSGTHRRTQGTARRVRHSRARTAPGVGRAGQQPRHAGRRSPGWRRRAARATTPSWPTSTQRLPADPPATVKDFVDHIDYAVKLIGVDHVGISSDFDGGGGLGRLA